MERNVPKLRFKGFNDEWRRVAISDITSLIKDGTHGTHKDVENGPYLLSAKNIKDGKIIISDTDRKISLEEYESIYKNYRLEKNDILLSIVGTIGRIAIAENIENIAFQRSVAILRFDKGNPRYVYQFMNTDQFQNDLIKNQVVSAQPGIYLNDIKKLDIAIPSLQEQEKIANFLTKIDKIIEKQEEKVKNLENYKKGMMQKIFSQEIRFKDENGEEYPEWEEKRIGNITQITDGVHFTPEYVDNGIPFWSVETIVSGANPKFITREAHNLAIKRCHPEKNDILMTRIGSLAKSKVISSNEELSIYVSVALIKASDKFNSKFMKQYFDSEIYLKEFLSKSLLTATPKKINMEDLKTTKVILPCLEEQRKIAKVLSNIDLILEKQNMKLEELREWKKGLLQNMFV